MIMRLPSVQIVGLFVLLWPLVAAATHNRAGEIHIQQTGALTIEATIITYTVASSVQADRDSLLLCWGDGACQYVKRSNGNGSGEVLPNNVKYNLYVATHTYSGRATYTISMTDPNRNGNVLNVNGGASDAVPFHLQTTYTLLNTQFQGINTTPYLLQPPLDRACVGQPFIHNPNAYDPDGDSLAYFLIAPMADVNTPVPLYVFPNNIGSNPLNVLGLNAFTGDLIWQVPELVGEYNVAMIIVSYRSGVAIDTTVRDMQILVEGCLNTPPVVDAPNLICVVAGSVVEFDVSVSDPNSGQLVQLTALGAPLTAAVSPAVFDVVTGYQPPVLTGSFMWQTTCEHIAPQPYSVIFKGTDNFFGPTGLADLQLTRIKVVGPPPLDVQAEALQGAVRVSWQAPYVCQDVADDYFYRFSVWRRLGSNPFDIDTCTPGLAGKGYTRVAWLDDYPLVAGRYQYEDLAVERGRTYCYRIVADFAKRSSAGFPYNITPGLPSNEACVQLSRDVPLMLNVDVETTDNSAGSVFVRWSKPDPVDLDTLQLPPPYRYRLQRLVGAGFVQVPGADFVSNSYWQANDTSFMVNALDTDTEQHTFRVGFYTGTADELLGYSEQAQSIYLTVASTDRENQLSWQALTPWSDTSYTILRRNLDTNVFEELAITNTTAYRDTGLINGLEYCYLIEATGTYSVVGVPGPLFNTSQEQCGIPLDTIPPCAPVFTVRNPCDNLSPGTPVEDLINTISWQKPTASCPNTDDLAGYHVYYAPSATQPLTRIATFTDTDVLETTHVSDGMGLAGCYAVTAFDSLGNESPIGDLRCVDNCPFYFLPNTFTPNGDGHNDRFVPYPYRFISRVEFEVRSTWGNLLYQTNDPDLGWDGTNLQGQTVPEGTYYYVCRVFEQRLGGEVPQPMLLNGFIELIR
jgi:gliding motility-associated-like protein